VREEFQQNLESFIIPVKSRAQLAVPKSIWTVPFGAIDTRDGCETPLSDGRYLRA
jgi:hypothetical protein